MVVLRSTKYSNSKYSQRMGTQNLCHFMDLSGPTPPDNLDRISRLFFNMRFVLFSLSVFILR